MLSMEETLHKSINLFVYLFKIRAWAWKYQTLVYWQYPSIKKKRTLPALQSNSEYEYSLTYSIYFNFSNWMFKPWNSSTSCADEFHIWNHICWSLSTKSSKYFRVQLWLLVDVQVLWSRAEACRNTNNMVFCLAVENFLCKDLISKPYDGFIINAESNVIK